MCGIAGIHNFAINENVDENILRKMCSVLEHRGPDDEGFYCKGNIGLGHRRLSIIDIELGHQPMSNEDGSVWIVFNGEIYNFLSLRDGLIKRGHIFKTRCDTEVILHLYEEEKEACLERLNGMFAFAIWDERNRSLFLARDRLGVKPLHYSISGNKLIFASEIKAILQDPSIKRAIDYEALHDYLSLIYVPAPKTMFEGISKLPAGHYLICTRNKIRIEKYWDIDFSRTTGEDEGQICDNIYSRLKEAVKLRLISDVPLGAFLSGGIDSSSVVSLMSELQEAPVITNSIGFCQKDYDELRYAKTLAKRYSTDHHEYIVEPKALEIMDKLFWLYDEPFGDSSSIPTYYVSEMSRKNVKVALAGDGGDENFAGYRRYWYTDAAIRFQRYLPNFLKYTARQASAHISAKYANPTSLRIKNKLEELYISPVALYFKMMAVYREEEKFFLYSGKIKEKMRHYDTEEKFKEILDRCGRDDYVSKLQYLDIKTYLCDDILVKVDRASMANSLEVRAPFLDYRFMEYTASIPSRLKLRGRHGKYIFKKAMAAKLPRQILIRSKMGFAVPLNHWIKNELNDMIAKELFRKDGIVNELFDMRHVHKVWSDASQFPFKTWLLFVFSRWFEKYVR